MLKPVLRDVVCTAFARNGFLLLLLRLVQESSFRKDKSPDQQVYTGEWLRSYDPATERRMLQAGPTSGAYSCFKCHQKTTSSLRPWQSMIFPTLTHLTHSKR